MEKFVEYLTKNRFGSSKQRFYYEQWVRNLYRFVKKTPGQHVDNIEIEKFVTYLSDTHHDWQVQQAKNAIRIYLYFQRNILNTV